MRKSIDEFFFVEFDALPGATKRTAARVYLGDNSGLVHQLTAVVHQMKPFPLVTYIVSVTGDTELQRERHTALMDFIDAIKWPGG